MTVTDVRCRRLTAALHSPFVTALRATSTVETLVVELVDSDGLHGFGESPQVWRVTGESLAGAEACLLGPLRDVVIGRSVDDLADLLLEAASAVVANHGAKAALDVALHDLAARRRGVSLPRYLGTRRHCVDTDVTVSAGDADRLAEDATARAKEGFTALKLKVGTDAETDASRIRAVRDAVGPDVRIRVDANQGWSARQSIAEGGIRRSATGVRCRHYGWLDTGSSPTLTTAGNRWQPRASEPPRLQVQQPGAWLPDHDAMRALRCRCATAELPPRRTVPLVARCPAVARTPSGVRRCKVIRGWPTTRRRSSTTPRAP